MNNKEMAHYSELQKTAQRVRAEVLEMIVSAGKGHIGGSFSCTDILVSLYCGGILQVQPKEPRWSERDRFVFSKGHSTEALYAVLSEVGFFSKDILRTYGQAGSVLGGHADKSIPGIEVSTGSLGHGLGIAAGLALAAKLDKKTYWVYALLGDGECYEGSVWESAMFASHFGLNQLIAIVDRNRQITLDYTENCNHLEPFEDKWKAFGWDTAVVNGHSFEELLTVFETSRSRTTNRPLVIIANTIKGKGVSYMEGSLNWHHNVPKGEQVDIARKDLAKNISNGK